MDFHGEVIAITGACGFIGRATVNAFLEKGGRVALIDRNEKKLKETIEQEKWNREKILAVSLDVTKESEVKEGIAKIVEHFGKIDVLFNNAGIEGDVGLTQEITKENFNNVMNVNVNGVFYGIKHVLPYMIDAKKGSIINTASDASVSTSYGLTPYVAAKHAVVGLTKNAAIENAEHNVRVNAVSPASINSRLMRSLEEGSGNPEEARQMYVDKIPMKRYGEPDEVAQVVLFLASNSSSFVTGANYYVDGGRITK